MIRTTLKTTIYGALLLVLAGCAAGGAGARRAYLERLETDLREASEGFTGGTLSGRQYLALSVDRAGKIRRFQDDQRWRAEAKTDQDRDGVPDRYDDCPRTPRLQPTDERGCPLKPYPDCDERDARCGPTADDDRRTRNLLDEATVMFNPRCDGSPAPQTPEPMEWGRGPQTPTGRHGFNLAVTEVTNQSPGCELFYEMEFRVEWQPPPSPPNQPKVRYITVLFKASEDLKPGDPRRAVFGIPMPEEVPVPPARDGLRRALSRFSNVRWKVRAVNGAQVTSSWSSVREQGPASSGVDG